jgi:hypothetical protein
MMLDEIITDIKKRLADQPDSRCASADEVRICWLISELEGIKKRHAELMELVEEHFKIKDDLDKSYRPTKIDPYHNAYVAKVKAKQQAETALREFLVKNKK